eukprot:2286159-Pyramimonas_sp.AAC.1
MGKGAQDRRRGPARRRARRQLRRGGAAAVSPWPPAPVGRRCRGRLAASGPSTYDALAAALACLVVLVGSKGGLARALGLVLAAGGICPSAS